MSEKQSESHALAPQGAMTPGRRRELTSKGMTFGEALELVKADSRARVARIGWNGKGMYVYLFRPAPHAAFWHRDIGPELHDRMQPFLCMHTATGDEQPGWLASQADMLANDWLDVSAHVSAQSVQSAAERAALDPDDVATIDVMAHRLLDMSDRLRRIARDGKASFDALDAVRVTLICHVAELDGLLLEAKS